MEMIWVPAGKFRMGDLTGNGNGDERPVRRVQVSGYYLAATEVSQAQWRRVVDVGVIDANPSVSKNSRLPVENVSWDNAIEFCRRLNAMEQNAGRLPEGYVYTLPTEAQWEMACRSGVEEDWAGNPDAMGWYAGNTRGSSCFVAWKKPNAWGFHDMHGNVWEWCRDWYQDSYQGLPLRDPAGAPSGRHRVVRGGSWSSDNEEDLRSSRRSRLVPPYRANNIGFRVALVLDQPA